MAISSPPIAIESEPPQASYRAFLFPLVAGIAVLLFFAAPWSLEHKAHVALHGLCAQRPSHSFVFGDRRLPFDARMTGIYGGFLGATIYLVARGRHRAAGMPPSTSLGLLVLFVGAMAADGFNSLLLDMGWWHPYRPDNRLRLVTGLMTGVALAVAICFLLAMVLWRQPQLERRVVAGAWEPLLLLALQAPFALLVVAQLPWLFAPVTVALLLSATEVVSAMMTVVAVMAKTADNTFERLAQIQGYAVVGFLLGLAMMAGLGGGRFLLETLTHAAPLT
jgi:uncharacterized membrane protein